jgi:hypothetical protein
MNEFFISYFEWIFLGILLLSFALGFYLGAEKGISLYQNYIHRP